MHFRNMVENQDLTAPSRRLSKVAWKTLQVEGKRRLLARILDAVLPSHRRTPACSSPASAPPARGLHARNRGKLTAALLIASFPGFTGDQITGAGSDVDSDTIEISGQRIWMGAS